MYTTSIPLIQYQLSRNISSRVWLPSPFSTFLHISWTVLPRLSDRVGAKHARLQNKLNQLAQGRQTAITLPQSLTWRGCVGQHVVLQNHSSTYSMQPVQPFYRFMIIHLLMWQAWASTGCGIARPQRLAVMPRTRITGGHFHPYTGFFGHKLNKCSAIFSCTLNSDLSQHPWSLISPTVFFMVQTPVTSCARDFRQ